MIVTDAITMDDEKAALAYAPVTARPAEPGFTPFTDDENAPQAPLYDTSLPLPNGRAQPRRSSKLKRVLHILILVPFFCFVVGSLARKFLSRPHGPKRHGVHANGLSMDWAESEVNMIPHCIEKPNWSRGPDTLLSEDGEAPDYLHAYFDNEEVPLNDVDDVTEDEDSSKSISLESLGTAPFHASHKFSLSSDVDIIRLFSRGPSAYGYIVVEEGETANGNIEVDVNVSYWSKNALDRVVVCRLTDPQPSHDGHRLPSPPLPPHRPEHPKPPHRPEHPPPPGAPPPRKPDHPKPPHGPDHPPPPPPHGPKHPKHPAPPHHPPGHGEHDKLKVDSVGIFTPRLIGGPPGRKNLQFTIKVRFPPLDASDANATRPAFTTDLTNFKHAFEGDLEIPKVFVKTSNSQVHAENLTVTRAFIKSSNGPITGNFEIWEGLTLVTSNAPIHVKANLYSSNSTRATRLGLRTSNGVIDSSFGLHNATDDSTGSFAIAAGTSNAPSSLTVFAHPVDAPLHLVSKTSNNHASVSLHPAYEGRFVLATSNGHSEVHADDGVPDPSGADRERHVSIDVVKGGGLAEGRVWWGEEEEELEGENDGEKEEKKGRVFVKTSNAPVDLYLPAV